MKAIDSSEVHSMLLNHLVRLMKKRDNERKMESMELQFSFLHDLMERKVNKVKLFEMQIGVIKEDLAMISNKLASENVINKSESQTSSSGDFRVQNSVSTKSSQQNLCIQTNFDELADNYIQKRIPLLPMRMA